MLIWFLLALVLGYIFGAPWAIVVLVLYILILRGTSWAQATAIKAQAEVIRQLTK